MQKELLTKLQNMFTHEQYRSAGVAHLLNMNQECEFYYQGRLITKEQADKMVIEYFKRKNGESKSFNIKRDR